MSAILEQLIQRRKELHISQQEVAKRMNTGQTTVARIETGARSPKLETVERFARALGCDIVLKRND
ncbi:helix-turn-helix domain-containing protein [Mitsuokella sp. AF21-1AC]|uniref:helix-turn-helix domain-containing protein n=1 Tax=Mitsuokella sp. AF21-1AC TaxID=2292235 RepID=UPI000E53DA15|nr:helix-turn-helix transcriptional regulator [Mitsuokella sp. AF21-1AC]RGS71639.1 XRE family transcriptional regulator [Mitsuokella sp. AF21-1AC]